MHLIDYGHMRAGVLYHGTISDLDGSPQSTWTYEDGGAKVTRDQPIDEETFAFLWNGVAQLGVFQRALVRGPGVPIDPVSHHVVGIAFKEGNQQGQYLFLIPADETDPEFVRWLAALNVPQGKSG
jgi:hypothetical protein